MKVFVSRRTPAASERRVSADLIGGKIENRSTKTQIFSSLQGCAMASGAPARVDRRCSCVDRALSLALPGRVALLEYHDDGKSRSARTEKTRVVLTLALKGFARAGFKVVYVCRKAMTEADVKATAGSIPRKDRALRRILFKYISSGQDLIEYFACAHLRKEPPTLYVIDELQSFFNTTSVAGQQMFVKAVALVRSTVLYCDGELRRRASAPAGTPARVPGCRAVITWNSARAGPLAGISSFVDARAALSEVFSRADNDMYRKRGRDA